MDKDRKDENKPLPSEADDLLKKQAEDEALPQGQTELEAENEADDEDFYGEVVLPSAVERKFDKQSQKASERKAEERRERSRQLKEERKKARKKYIPLYIVSGLFALFALVYFGLQALEPEDALEDVKVDTSTSYDYLIYYDTNMIDSLEFKYDDGYSYKVKLSRYLDESGYTKIDYQVAGKTQFVYSEDKWSNMMNAIYTITSNTKVVSGPDDLATYGLDKPRARVTYYVYDNRGAVTEGKTLLLGAPAPVGTGTYAMIEGSDTIYVCGYADTDYLLAKDYEYRALNICTLTDYMNDVNEVKITKDGTTLAVRALTDDEKKELSYITTYRIEQPINFACNTVYAQDKLFIYFATIDALRVVEDFPTDLAAYGLSEADEPITVEMTDSAGKYVKISLGAPTGEADGEVYGKINGETSIYVFSMVNFQFLDLTYNDLMDMTIWQHPIMDADHVDMYLDGETHTLTLEKTGADTLRGWLDGEETTEDNARYLYTRFLQIYLFDIYPEGTEIGETKYWFRIVNTDGTEHLMELKAIGSRKFAVFINGEEQGYYVTSADLKNIVEGVATVKAGDKLTYTL